MKRLLYLILKKDMIKKLSKLHGEQFIDDVMKTFGVPSNLMDKYNNQHIRYQVPDRIKKDIDDVLYKRLRLLVDYACKNIHEEIEVRIRTVNDDCTKNYFTIQICYSNGISNYKINTKTLEVFLWSNDELIKIDI